MAGYQTRHAVVSAGTDPIYRLSCLDVSCLFAFGAGIYFERNLLAFFQCFETIHVDCREVSEQIFAAFIRSDKTKTLSVIKPFYGTGCHEILLPIQKINK